MIVLILPVTNDFLNNDIEIVEPTSNTFYLDIDRDVVFGFTDGREAMKQAIYLILSIERYQYVILPWSYGVEFADLFGMPISWVIPEAQRRIEEALLQDTRIKAVDNFNFEVGKGVLLIRFTAHTIFGDVDTEREVKF